MCKINKYLKWKCIYQVSLGGLSKLKSDEYNQKMIVGGNVEALAYPKHWHIMSPWDSGERTDWV